MCPVCLLFVSMFLCAVYLHLRSVEAEITALARDSDFLCQDKPRVVVSHLLLPAESVVP